SGYAFKYLTPVEVIKYQSNAFSTMGGGWKFSYYGSSVNGTSQRIEFDNSDILEANILPWDITQITKFQYNSTTGDTAWFLWGDNVYGAYDNVVIEEYETVSIETDIDVGVYPVYAAITPDGNYVYVANEGPTNEPGTVSVIRTADNTVVATIDVGDGAHYIVFTPNGDYAYVLNEETSYGQSGTVSVIDTASNNVVETIVVGRWPKSLAITPDGDYVYVANTGVTMNDPDTVSVISTASNTVVKTITVGNRPHYIVFT
ncbi:unnamed protein product, partial [marine sediment metagenome]